jgi:hypothetical protein
MTATSNNWIVVRPAPSVTLPAQGTRIHGPTVAGRLPRIATPNSIPALATAIGANGWRLIGLDITATPSATINYGLVRVGDGQATTLAQLPSRIILDRMWVHGHAALHVQRCVQLNAGVAAVVDSYLSDCHGKGSETQGIGGWNGSGPWKVENNYVEGGTIGMLVGGADPKIVGLVPSDIEVRNNHFFKPLAWKGVWTVKNAFELKNAKRVLVEGNVLENNWVDAQNGFIILFQALNQENTAPWTTVQDVTFRYNLVRNSPAGVNILSRVAYPYGGRAAQMPTQPSQRIMFAHNVFENVGLTGAQRLFQLLGDLVDVTLLHNTGAANHSALLLAPGAAGQGAMTRFVAVDNLFGRGSYGVYGDVVGEGAVALTKYAPGAVVSGNAIYGTHAGGVPVLKYPAGSPVVNAYPLTSLLAGILPSVTPLGAIGILSTTFPPDAVTTLLRGTDGIAPGADLVRLRSALARTVN